MAKPTRPKARPSDRKSSPNDEGFETRTVKSATRPKARPEKMKTGGMCRGGGKATKGKSYSKSG